MLEPQAAVFPTAFRSDKWSPLRPHKREIPHPSNASPSSAAASCSWPCSRLSSSSSSSPVVPGLSLARPTVDSPTACQIVFDHLIRITDFPRADHSDLAYRTPQLLDPPRRPRRPTRPPRFQARSHPSANPAKSLTKEKAYFRTVLSSSWSHWPAGRRLDRTKRLG